jgi:hypothetical protein
MSDLFSRFLREAIHIHQSNVGSLFATAYDSLFPVLMLLILIVCYFGRTFVCMVTVSRARVTKKKSSERQKDHYLLSSSKLHTVFILEYRKPKCSSLYLSLY